MFLNMESNSLLEYVHATFLCHLLASVVYIFAQRLNKKNFLLWLLTIALLSAPKNSFNLGKSFICFPRLFEGRKTVQSSTSQKYDRKRKEEGREETGGVCLIHKHSFLSFLPAQSNWPMHVFIHCRENVFLL